MRLETWEETKARREVERAARDAKLRKRAALVKDAPAPSYPWGLFGSVGSRHRASWRCFGFYPTRLVALFAARERGVDRPIVGKV